jgi:hypothetical protein
MDETYIKLIKMNVLSPTKVPLSSNDYILIYTVFSGIAH